MCVSSRTSSHTLTEVQSVRSHPCLEGGLACGVHTCTVNTRTVTLTIGTVALWPLAQFGGDSVTSKIHNICGYSQTQLSVMSLIESAHLATGFNQTWSSSGHIYTGCPGANVPEFGRMFLTLKYTDITRNTYVYPKLNGYGDNCERKVWSSCGSTFCTCFVCCYSYTAHVRPSVSQPSQAHSAFIINRCHSYSELQFNTAGYSCAM